MGLNLQEEYTKTKIHEVLEQLDKDLVELFIKEQVWSNKK